MKAQELRDYASQLKAVIETAIDGIITIDSSGKIESINEAALSLFKYESGELIGENVKILMPQPYKAEHDSYISNYVQSRIPQIIGIGREVIGQTKNGDTFPFRLAVSEVILHNRVLFTGIIHDLSEVKKAEKDLKDLNLELENKIAERTIELEDAINQLLATNTKLKSQELDLIKSLEKEKELNKLKSRFVSMASHEFRTPLSTILSSAALISRYTQTENNDKRLNHIKKIKSSVNHLTGILNDFLSLAKIEEGKEIINIQKVNLEDICRKVVENIEGIKKANQTINQSFEKLYLYSDAKILKNILFNLVSNAIKYTPESGTIEVSCSLNNNIVTIKVSDNGIGIPMEDQKHLFTRFFRASNAENIQGTGLGLNIVKRYIEMLKGTITFHSEENKGSTFLVKFKYLS